ncbi:hypothetical protein BJV82DRAFT_673031 [Fennellomyces sp. T-0311]|nr:hypothetical protein BJV82DRAFT_673031 [Fennellomyces sp. T-0311]
MAEDTEKEEIIQRLHAACTGRWLIFDRLYNNKEALKDAFIHKKSKDQIETIMDELNDLLVSRSNAPPGTRLVTFHMIDRTDSEFWRDRNYFKGLQEYHDHRRSEEEISMLKREAERVRDGCQQYLSALNSAITVANSRNREGDMLYLSRWYNQVLSWTTEIISQLEYIPKSRERQAPAQTQDPDTIAIPIPDQQATAVILPIQDDTLYGEEETVQTVEDLVAIEDDDTINGYY